MSTEDTIGVVREHRWASAKAQRERLKADGCRVILELGGKKLQRTREELEGLVRAGTVVKLVHAFLLADPRNKRKTGGSKADFVEYLHRLIDPKPKGRGGIVKDVDTQLTTDNPAKRQAIIALSKELLGKSGQGLKSAMNGKRSQGRQPLDLTPDQKRDGKAVWRDLVDYPTWDAAERGLQAVHPAFTVHRANRLWGPRKSKPR